jgi:hypothetical protein
MQEKLNDHDISTYQDAQKHEFKAGMKKVLDITKQYLLNKNNIIEVLSETPLLPYLLEMEYLVGEYENLMVSDSPTETLWWFKQPNGVTEKMNIEMDQYSLKKWNVFRLKTDIKNKQNEINIFTCYMFIQITTEVNYFLFSVYGDKVYDQEITLTFLDKQPAIKRVREAINNVSTE